MFKVIAPGNARCVVASYNEHVGRGGEGEERGEGGGGGYVQRCSLCPMDERCQHALDCGGTAVEAGGGAPRTGPLPPNREESVL